jgi:hypothetical protein
VARPAAAYDFTVGLRTIGQGYQVRRFGADGSNELLSRRRLTQYMDLAVFDLAPGRWRGDDGDRNLIYFDASLRFDSDFGGYMLGRPTGTDEIHELKQSQLDILYMFLGGQERRRARRLRARAADPFRSGRLLRVRRRRRDRALVALFRRPGLCGHRGSRRAAAVGADLRD